MLQFIETIRVVDGTPQGIEWHQARMNETYHHFFPTSEIPSISHWLHDMTRPEGITKVRIVYGKEGIADMTLQPYTPKPIHSLKLVTDDTIDYSYKSTNRSHLNRVLAQKENCDDVIIVKNGLLTDTSYTNIALFDGKRWITPRTPLLKGTMRARLLAEGKITEQDITPHDIDRFRSIALFNAMLDMGSIVVDCSKIS